jgi:hypothetical protein
LLRVEMDRIDQSLDLMMLDIRRGNGKAIDLAIHLLERKREILGA